MTQPSRLKRIETALAALFPADVAVALCTLSAADPRDLWPAERQAVIGAVPRRLAEFAAGRQAARTALAALGHPAVALPMGPDRAAIWPDGIAGSIAHAAGLAVAVARPGAPLGVDVEDDSPLPQEAVERIGAVYRIEAEAQEHSLQGKALRMWLEPNTPSPAALTMEVAMLLCGEIKYM